VTHTYIYAIKQPTLGYLTRSVRRRAARSNGLIAEVQLGHGNLTGYRCRFKRSMQHFFSRLIP
jgi:hypothetical protein